MSFLGDVDDPVVVQEALALIDACDSVGGLEDASTGDSSSASEGQLDHSTVHARQEAQAKPSKRRIKSFASSSTRQLQKKRAEAVALREQVIVLQAHLAWLTRARYAAAVENSDASHTAASGMVRSEGYERAVAQFVKRQQSEKTNRRLKAVVANQKKLCESLRAALGRKSVIEDMNLIFENATPLYRPLATLDHSSRTMRQLEQRVERLYVDSEAVFTWDQPCLVAARMSVNCNTQYGKMIEIETVTPVACSIQEACVILWKDLKTVHEIPDKRYRYLRGVKPNSLEKNFVMKLRGQSSDIVVDGSHFSRKFEEQDRVVLAKADSIMLQTEGLQFRSPSWTIISTAPGHQVVVRSYLRIYSEVQPNLTAQAKDVETTRAFVLDGLSKMMYGCTLKTQSELIQQAMIM